MQMPQINRNGSDGMNLACQYQEAASALDNAMNKMMYLIHGRDYQTLPSVCYTTARQEMRDRLEKMTLVREELTRIALHCAETR